jgi:hypothetical protein
MPAASGGVPLLFFWDNYIFHMVFQFHVKRETVALIAYTGTEKKMGLNSH